MFDSDEERDPLESLLTAQALRGFFETLKEYGTASPQVLIEEHEAKTLAGMGGGHFLAQPFVKIFKFPDLPAQQPAQSETLRDTIDREWRW